MFFSFFPELLYDDKKIKDLSRKIRAIELDDPKFMYDEYHVQDGERPDVLSNRFYGVPYYHWVLLVTNDLTLRTWPKSDRRMDSYLATKYEGMENETASWLDSSGRPVSKEFPASIQTTEGPQSFWFSGDGYGVVSDGMVYSVEAETKSYLELEKEANEKASVVRILDKAFLGRITDLASRLLGA